MINQQPAEELQSSLIESFQKIEPILKALGTEQRQKLLISFLDGPKSFQELKEQLNLGRTAVSNHLRILKQVELIDKIHHGYYRITQKGQVFLQAINWAYEFSQTQELKRKEAEQKKFLLESFLDRKNH
jgi:predicted transcriptional regulator